MQPVDALYLHFPFCKHLCNYCDFYKHVLERETQVTEFEKLLMAQWDRHDHFLNENNFKLTPLRSFYIGGGTPSLWGESGVNFINKLIQQEKLLLADDCEFTLEVDPNAWDKHSLSRWRELGVNRISIGAQSFQDRYLTILDRSHSEKDVETTLKYFSESRLNFSIDLLIGIPDSNQRDTLSELSRFTDYNPSHFSVYILKTRANYPHKSELPAEEETAEEYLKVCEFLEKNSYKQYEVSNFSKVGKESRHNKKYWKYESVAGIGPAATGLLVKDDQSIRYQWKASSSDFKQELLQGTSLIIEKLFLQFRTSDGIDLNSIFTKPNEQEIITTLYNYWEQHGYLAECSSRQRIVLSARGYLMSDSILNDLFREIDF